jgi:hypothetical protein
MTETYVDTTILVEALLKTRRRREKALARLNSTPSVLSAYAIKEFKAGALQHWIWLHNKLRTTRSLKDTYGAIGQNLRSPYRVGTAMEALQVGAEALGMSAYSNEKSPTQLDRRNADVYAITLRRRILKAWAERRKVTTKVIGEVECFAEESPFYDERLGLMENPAKHCPRDEECGFAPGYKAAPDKLSALLVAIKEGTRKEDTRRRAALHKLRNSPRRQFGDKDCRDMGDAHFALTCPIGAAILTSNVKDHEMLAGSIGIPVERYDVKQSSG